MIRKITLPLFVIMAICITAYAAKDPNQNKEKPKMADQKSTVAPRVELTTSKGKIVVELDAAKAPITVKNFLTYVNEGFYADTIFHRIIPGFMIQGGGMTADMKQKPNHAPIAIESKNGLKNMRGTLAMARTNDPNSATSQFFINTVDNDFLNYKGASNPGYAVFGKVVEGMDVADAIEKVKTRAGDVPVETITIISAKEIK
ncbi:MAG: peptidylprolyl isomerase [Sedimentisphaerales bacterium]|nr:peptidylprolyl isomerase [Sedimentisphaerales bacterium]